MLREETEGIRGAGQEVEGIGPLETMKQGSGGGKGAEKGDSQDNGVKQARGRFWAVSQLG